MPICLSSKLKHSPKNNTIGVGWGRTWNGNVTLQTNMLREYIIPIDPWKHCAQIDDDDPKTELCVGRGMHSVYHGDNGGPLMEVVHKRFYEVGITSRGDPYADSQITDDSDFEDVYTFVPAYCDWIEEATNGEVKCQ